MTRRLSLLLTAVLAFGLVSLAAAQQQDSPNPAPNPLVQLLQSKGVVTAQEAAAINQAATPTEQNQRLTELLVSKGIITQEEYKRTAASQASFSSGQTLVPAAAHYAAADPEPAMAAAPQAPAGPAVIPAVAPVRVLTSDPPKAGGLVPDIKLGSGAKVKLYGFIKATTSYDTSNPYNTDFPLPGLGGTANGSFPSSVPVGLTSPFAAAVPGVGSTDSGPNGAPMFYTKASATRMGANFEWPDISGSNNTLTGRIEADWEGNFSRATNRNVSSLRTRMLATRLAFVRLDHRMSDQTTAFVLFGMDWTPFGSSIQANLLETTGGAAFFGALYERSAQIRAGLWHNFGGSRNFTLGIEPAITMPGWGSPPADTGVQLGVSERQGQDSGVPDVQGRIVLQWQLDTAKGVAPAQIVFSGMWARRREIVNRTAIANLFCVYGVTVADPATDPATITSNIADCSTRTAAQAAAATALVDAFPHGATVSSQRWGGTAGVQLPTRYATLIANYFTGADLTYYFGGQLLRPFSDTVPFGGLFATPGGAKCGGAGSGCPTAFSMDASPPNVVFGFDAAGNPHIVSQKPVRAVGGIAQISFPLSRIFNANPAGRNAGWTLAFAAGTDQAKARDVRFFAGAAGQRDRSDMAAATLTWKFNQFVNFAYETSWWDTHSICTAPLGPFSGCSGTPFRGFAARRWHDYRNEFGPIFTF